MSDRGQCNEIIPGKLYQRRQFITWSYKRKQSMLGDLNIRTVVNLWHKCDAELSNPRRTYLHWPCPTSVVPDDADEIVAWGVGRMRRGAVLVHCEAGKGRSVWYAARLLSLHAGVPRSEALAYVYSRVPAAGVHPVLLEDLQ